MAVSALQKGTSTGADSAGRVLGRGELEVAVLERSRPRRAFRRISGAALDALLPAAPTSDAAPTDGDTDQGAS